jgi:hypothetical protein
MTNQLLRKTSLLYNGHTWIQRAMFKVHGNNFVLTLHNLIAFSGPFPSDTMQSWYDQLYFPDDLQMKRVDIDNNWMTVADIKRRATGTQIYLCHLRDFSTPPGLPRTTLDTTGPPLYGKNRPFLQEQGMPL